MFKSGEYYVGDLCVVMNEEEWSEVCDLLDIRGDGVHELSNGKRIGIFYTEHGDGEYFDQNGNVYGVDSGTIGCILASEIDTPIDDSMVLIDFNYDFDIGESDGTLSFGHIDIETKGRFEDEYHVALTDDAEYDWDNDTLKDDAYDVGVESDWQDEYDKNYD